jgi:GNAT superfamily N-acetyltransferase
VVWEVERLDHASWERLRSIRLRALDDEPDAFGSSSERESAYGPPEWQRLLALGPWWVAVAHGEDVGVVAGGHHREYEIPWVFSMWVGAPWRGRGVADALLEVVVSWAATQGATRLGLEVADRVPRARRFYARFGFAESDDQHPMPRDPTITLHEMFIGLADVQDRAAGLSR